VPFAAPGDREGGVRKGLGVVLVGCRHEEGRPTPGLGENRGATTLRRSPGGGGGTLGSD
jgi:hypothetical protein